MKNIILISTAFYYSFCFCQTDTIISYNVRNESIDTIVNFFDPAITSDFSLSNLGVFGNQVPLNLTTPTQNLFLGSDFTKLERAELDFDVLAYPIRTATKLLRYENEVPTHHCSGILVSPNIVLTAGHCVFAANQWIADSILVSPAYDNGASQVTLQNTVATNYYIFKSLYDGDLSVDIALLQLEESIGHNLGWVGMTFNSDDNYFNNKVFHKLSYPGNDLIFPPWGYTNGDTLYYNYGNVDVFSPQIIGVNSTEANAIQGQSGSSLFYTDNSVYLSCGVATASANYEHRRIDNSIFYAFTNVIDNYTASTHSLSSQSNLLSVYPNPFSSQATLSFKNLNNIPHTLFIYNSQGQLVRTFKGILTEKFTINKDNFLSGFYTFHLTNDEQKVGHGKFIIQ